jgi:mannonate dehydratase
VTNIAKVGAGLSDYFYTKSKTAFTQDINQNSKTKKGDKQAAKAKKTPATGYAFYFTYADVDKEKLWANLKYFLEALMPTCEECDIKMAIHMDDPPWDIFGLPRLLVNEENIDRFLKMVDNPYNALTLCSGSLNANPENDVAKIVRKHCDRIAFAHIRNVKHFPNGDFSEASHRDCDGDTRILDILKAYHDCGFEGYIRPDHGRHLWGEGPGTVRPGYGLYDRALGIMYMLGVWDMLDKLENK